MEERTQSTKFGIALPKNVVNEIEAQAKKLGMTRSEYIAKVLTGELRNTRERVVVAALKASKLRNPNDNLPYIQKLVEDSRDWLGSFDIETCTSQARERLLVGDELDPRNNPAALRTILRKYKEQSDYWGYAADKRLTDLRKFAEGVDLKENVVLRVWDELLKEGS